MNGKSNMFVPETVIGKDVDLRLRPEDGLIDSLCEALINSFNAAMKSGRLALGISESLDILDYEPSSIVVCILPHVKELNDPLKHLHHLLMEAFCKEHSIRLLKVASCEGFCALLKLLQQIDPANPYAAASHGIASIDASDLLIIKAAEPRSAGADEDLMSQYDVIMVRRRDAEGGSAATPVLPAVFPTYFDAT